MAIQQHTDVNGNSEAAILTRMIHPERADLPEEAAEAVLKLFGLDQSDSDRFHDLLVRNQDDSLTPAEKDELRDVSPRQHDDRPDARQGPPFPQEACLGHPIGMDAALQRLVWQRAGRRCEYCRLPQSESRSVFEIDHIIACHHHGRTVPGNLALSCAFWIGQTWCLRLLVGSILVLMTTRDYRDSGPREQWNRSADLALAPRRPGRRLRCKGHTRPYPISDRNALRTRLRQFRQGPQTAVAVPQLDPTKRALPGRPDPVAGHRSDPIPRIPGRSARHPPGTRPAVDPVRRP